MGSAADQLAQGDTITQVAGTQHHHPDRVQAIGMLGSQHLLPACAAWVSVAGTLRPASMDTAWGCAV